MIPLGLVRRVRAQALGWRFQEVHRCASDVAGLVICEYVTVRTCFVHVFTNLSGYLLTKSIMFSFH